MKDVDVCVNKGMPCITIELGQLVQVSFTVLAFDEFEKGIVPLSSMSFLVK